MTSLRSLLLGLGVFLCVSVASADVTLKPSSDVTVALKDVTGGISLTATRGGSVRYLGVIATSSSKVYTQTATDTFVMMRFGSNSVLTLSVVVSDERVHINVRWVGDKTVRYQDCFKLSPHQWFGGPQQKVQLWPVQKLTLREYSFVTKEDDNCAIVDPYWVNSEGTVIYVNKEVPLFVDQNNTMPDHMCLISAVKAPYSAINRPASILSYDIVLTNNAKVGHEFAVGRYLGKPISYPDFRMIQHPVWSTWARYYRPINQTIVMNFAKEIVAHGFNNAQFEVDDLWEICYGSATVDTRKFPDFRQMVRDLKAMGFRVTMWVHPFINENCNPWHNEARDKGFLIKTEDGSVFTSWWNNNGTRASHFDFTNVEATKWWIERLMVLKNTYEIDSFKFDAGESGWTPQVPVQRGFYGEHPSHVTIDYVRAISDFGPMIEVRTGQRTQDLPVFVRMIDKDTSWSFNNGLPTLVTTLLQMNMNGYPLVLPDMIGGNAYNDTLPSKELFIRWLQANTFMPSLQYSIVPWDYDAETIEICRRYTDLHAEHAEDIRAAMRRAVDKGTPVNGPIWWNDPNDQEALAVDDEYLLGDDILVAPVMLQGAVSRDVYLPAGIWKYANTSELYFGAAWYRDVPAPLDTLLYYKRAVAISSASTMTPAALLLSIVVTLAALLK